MSDLTRTLRVIEPYPGLFAYYDGRIAGRRLHAVTPNWLDDGAFDLGTASYALVDGDQALVYDTHMTLAHAEAVRAHLHGLGVTALRVALSHWHADHVAGNAVFGDCEIIALQLTANTLLAHRDELAARSPALSPLVLPNRTFERRLDLEVGARRVELHHFDIHSADGLVAWLPEPGILLAGDTLEDTVTYMTEPEHAATHLRELARLRTWTIGRILPNHGDPDRIAAGGYAPDLIDANRRYIAHLTEPGRAACSESLRDVVAHDLAAGAITYFAPYEAVHRHNLAAVAAAA